MSRCVGLFFAIAGSPFWHEAAKFTPSQSGWSRSISRAKESAELILKLQRPKRLEMAHNGLFDLQLKVSVLGCKADIYAAV